MLTLNSTQDELSAAVVVNIINHLPRHGGIESSRWATNSQDVIQSSESIEKPPKKGVQHRGYSKNASYKKGVQNKGPSKNASYGKGFFNSGFCNKNSPRNDSPKREVLLASPPLDPKTEAIVPEAHKSRGVNPLAKEFIPSTRQKSSVLEGGLATSIYAVEASVLGTTSKYSLPSSRLPRRQDGRSFSVHASQICVLCEAFLCTHIDIDT